MNKLIAKVEDIRSDEFFSCITVRVNGTDLKLLKTEVPKWLRIGDEVECRVQEAAIALYKGDKDESVSIENHISGELQHFRKGMVLSEVSVETPCGKLNSLITTDAFNRMELCEGCNVTLLLKAVDIKLTPLLDTVSYENCKDKIYQATKE
ncbi:MAG: molybdopterin-binding protein [Sulfuricurvum sp.]|uniref:TOBE domain-containing protein n=1 Tax=Sulfuricurvum sp. TaxID=2025608 RepID=UPI002619E143|nr:TOBE domain-containing protein [Sulfuricurvum sp.]MDD2838684.1 TOBE domain-containing protein [Sulfuricurvum sp.]MDD3596131.1 TOBE domain-containing protein [Sulfuricurvum sp.]MDD4883860.1 TOBE domain-containing protein [Sulfuricurvum sp.]